MSARLPRRISDSGLEWSPRQREVLDLLAKGQTNHQIAETLAITLDGAKWHVSQVMTRLGVDSREEAAEYWRVENGLPARLARFIRGLVPAAGATKIVAGTAGLAIAGVVGVAVLVTWRGSSSPPTSPPPADSTATPPLSVFPADCISDSQGMADWVGPADTLEGQLRFSERVVVGELIGMNPGLASGGGAGHETDFRFAVREDLIGSGPSEVVVRYHGDRSAGQGDLCINRTPQPGIPVILMLSAVPGAPANTWYTGIGWGQLIDNNGVVSYSGNIQVAEERIPRPVPYFAGMSFDDAKDEIRRIGSLTYSNMIIDWEGPRTSLAERVEGIDTIVMAQATGERELVFEPGAPIPYTNVTYRVNEWLKGTGPAEIKVRETGDMVTTLGTPDYPRPFANEGGVLFLQSDAKGGFYWSGGPYGRMQPYLGSTMYGLVGPGGMLTPVEYFIDVTFDDAVEAIRAEVAANP